MSLRAETLQMIEAEEHDRREALAARIVALEAVIRGLVEWHAEPWVPRGVNVVGLGSADPAQIDAARKHTQRVWQAAKDAVDN
jgi:hypothetical protein